MTKTRCLVCGAEFEDEGQDRNCSDAFYEIEQHMWNAHSKHQVEVVQQ